MGTIKDVYDLVEKLYKTTKDKQVLELLLPIKEKLISTDKELVEIQTKSLEVHKQIQAEIFVPQKENLDLKKLVTELEFKIKHKELKQIGIVKERPPK